MRRFEFVEGTSSKFWEIFNTGAEVTVRFGRIGTNGQTQIKKHVSEAKALEVIEKLIAEKTGKGYSEVAGDDAPKAAKPKADAPAKKADAAPVAKKADAAPKKKPGEERGWVDAGSGYELGLRDGKLAARKNGAPLASVPKPLKEGELGERLLAAADFLSAHAKSCVESVESWMLRSLTTPRKVLAAVFVDRHWRKALENAVVAPVDASGKPDLEAIGFFRGVASEDGRGSGGTKRGIGIVDRDGETKWLDAPSVWIPHPVALRAQLDDLRSLASELSLTQGIAQLFREVYTKDQALDANSDAISAYANAEFELLSHAFGAAKGLGYRVTGGSAITRVWERGRLWEARYWLGEGDPMYETTTGDLTWVDDKQRPLKLLDVPDIAYSEGMRMAAAIHAKRKIEKKEDADA